MTEKQFANHAVKMWRAVQSINRALKHRTKPYPCLGFKNARHNRSFQRAATRLNRATTALYEVATK
jgi:hypothetical protein